MQRDPLVSVLMPVYNCENYITEAVNSILNQTYRNLELIIVDDGCTDATMQKVLSANDPRVKVFTNEKNLGLAASLNIAIEHASGPYLARMDADDISMPERIARQVDRLQRDQQISILGTGLQYFNFSTYKNYFPEDHEACKAKLLFNVCLGHPSVVYRREIFDHAENFYNPELRQYSEDYELQVRLIDRYRMANLQEMYVKYRTFQPLVKSDAEHRRRTNSRAVRSTMLRNMGIDPSAQQLEFHQLGCALASDIDRQTFDNIIKWFNLIDEKNSETAYFDAKALKRALAEQAFFLLYANPRLASLKDLKKYSFFTDYKISPYLYVKSKAKEIIWVFHQPK